MIFAYHCDPSCRSARCPAALERIAAGWRNGRDIAPGVRGPMNETTHRLLIEAAKMRGLKWSDADIDQLVKDTAYAND